MQRALLLAAACLVACGAGASSTNGPPPPTGERFPIALHRPSRIGERAHLVSETAHREQTITTFGSQVVDSADATSAFRFDGIFEVLAIDAHGKPSELRYDVRSFTREEGQISSPVLAPGQVIALRTGATREDAHLLVDAAPVSEELVRALDEVLTLTRDDQTDDDLFGSTTPRAVSERWPANVTELVRGLEEHSPLRIDRSHVRSEAQVAERTTIAGVDGLTIAVVIDADHVQVEGLANGAQVRDGRLSFRIDGFFPIDTTMPRLRESIELHADLQMVIPTPRGEANVALTMTMTARRTYEPL